MPGAACFRAIFFGAARPRARLSGGAAFTRASMRAQRCGRSPAGARAGSCKEGRRAGPAGLATKGAEPAQAPRCGCDAPLFSMPCPRPGPAESARMRAHTAREARARVARAVGQLQRRPWTAGRWPNCADRGPTGLAHVTPSLKLLPARVAHRPPGCRTVRPAAAPAPVPALAGVGLRQAGARQRVAAEHFRA